MNSLILKTGARFLVPLMVLFSLFLLWRGHNLPGGGFIGGLFAATAFCLYAIAFTPAEARKIVIIDPRSISGLGVLFAITAGLIGLLSGQPFMTGVWLDIPTLDGPVGVGTPLIFDIGVYLVVIGFTLTTLLTLDEEPL